MSRLEKDIQKLRRNPKNVRPEDLESLLLQLGFEKRGGKGSHRRYKKQGYRPLVIPYRKPFLKSY